MEQPCHEQTGAEEANGPGHSSRVWRLVRCAPLPAADNMAIDEALVHCFDPHRSHPTLRLYGWEPPALSLGRFQKAAQVLDLECCRRRGLAVVRRITGGGAIYHASELTYSLVCAPFQIPPAASVGESFRILTGFLLAFYVRLGLPAGYARDLVKERTLLGRRTDFCFAGRESFDILIQGRKIGGNAQRRLRNIIFQHGSIPLSRHVEEGLACMADKSPRHAQGLTSLAECGIQSAPELLQEELLATFSRYFGVELREKALRPEEESWASTLKTMKYSTDSWNMEGHEEHIVNVNRSG